MKQILLNLLRQDSSRGTIAVFAALLFSVIPGVTIHRRRPQEAQPDLGGAFALVDSALQSEPVAASTQTWPGFLAELNRPDAPVPMHWPTFYIVGTPKAGTSSLYTQLKRHPQVFLPAHKETRFFQPEHKDSVSLDHYRALYADAEGYKAVGEITPWYLPDPLVPARIREACPSAKIVIILRDPVERAFSHYLNLRSTNLHLGGLDVEPATSFREAVRRYDDRSAKYWHHSQQYIEYSLYYAPVRRLLDTFGSDQVQVLLYDDLAKDPNGLLARIAQHIGVDPGFYDGLDVSEKSFPYHMPRFSAVHWLRRQGWVRWVPHSLVLAVRPIFFQLRKPPLDIESRRRLQALFDPDITRLEELLGRKLPELRKSWV